MTKRGGRIPLDDHINIPVTIPLKEALYEMANVQSRSLSDIVRECIVRWLSQNYEYFDGVYREKRTQHEARANIFKETLK